MNNDVIIVRFLSGEEVICTLEPLGEDSECPNIYKLHKPCMLRHVQQKKEEDEPGLMLVPFLPAYADQDFIEVKSKVFNEQVFYTYKVHPEFAKGYKKQVEPKSSLILPPSGLSVPKK